MSDLIIVLTSTPVVSIGGITNGDIDNVSTLMWNVTLDILQTSTETYSEDDAIRIMDGLVDEHELEFLRLAATVYIEKSE